MGANPALPAPCLAQGSRVLWVPVSFGAVGFCPCSLADSVLVLMPYGLLVPAPQGNGSSCCSWSQIGTWQDGAPWYCVL